VATATTTTTDQHKPQAAERPRMTPEDFVPAVREANKTELSRLGSSKALYALTAGEMEPDAVLTAMADDHAAAAETYEGWGAADSDVSGFFAGAAEAEQEAYEVVAGELDAHDPGEAPDLYAAMEGAGTPVERLGAFVGRTLVAKAHRSQATGFFTGQADPTTASTFRGLGDDLDDHLADGVELLDILTDDADDWEQAEAAANEVIGAAYDDYFSTLEELGVNPKPVC
jgi:hypothetical protein